MSLAAAMALAAAATANHSWAHGNWLVPSPRRCCGEAVITRIRVLPAPFL